MTVLPIRVGDTLLMKKKHPCGSDTFQVLRIGSDLRVLCPVCKRDMVLPRIKLEKNILRVISPTSEK